MIPDHAGVATAQLLVPTAITVLLIGVLSDRNNAVTWSVLWPFRHWLMLIN